MPETQTTPAGAQQTDTLEKMLARFAKQTDEKTATNLKDAIESSPDLKAKIEGLIKKGDLTDFGVFDKKSAEQDVKSSSQGKVAGLYEPVHGVLNLDQTSLAQLSTKNASEREAARYGMLHALAHETEHAVYRQDTLKIAEDTKKEVARSLYSGGTEHDYTGVIKDYVEKQGRVNEARAQIAGFNTVAKEARDENPKATLLDVYKKSPNNLSSFVEYSAGPPETASMKDGLALDKKTLQLDVDKSVTAAGKYYFDENRVINYKEYNAAPLIKLISQVEEANNKTELAKNPAYVAPKIAINMKDARLDEKKIERELRPADGKPRPDDKPIHYVDKSDGKDKDKTFDVPELKTKEPKKQATTGDGGASSESLLSALVDPRSASMRTPDPLFSQAMERLSALGPGAGGYANRIDLELLSGALAGRARDAKLPSITDVVASNDGQGLFAVWRNPGNAMDTLRASVDKAGAKDQTLDSAALAMTQPAHRQEPSSSALQEERTRAATMQRGA